MNRFLNVIIIASLVFALAACGGGGISNSAVPPSSTSAVPAGFAGKYIVTLQPGASVNDVSQLSRGLANAPQFIYESAIKGFAGQLSAAEVSQLKSNPLVKYVEPDMPVSIDKPGGTPGGPGNGGGGGGGSTPPPQEVPWGISRIDAYPTVGAGGTGVGVAVIDTGVDLDHPDLANVVDGADFIDGLPAEDDNGHGTHVSGTIAAADNAIGYVGVAPNATIIAVKVLNRRGSGSYSSVIAGINWVDANQATYNIKVANMSLGGSGYSNAMHDAIAQATADGVLFVVAAGNSFADASNYSPAAFNDTVLTISALDPDNTFAYYSNYGSVIDLIAPGTSVPSLWKNGGYNTISGTSMATPHVTGCAALWFDNHNGDFNTARNALLAAGVPAPVGGWIGDPDGINEPRADALGL